jgi:hypothetical protein
MKLLNHEGDIVASANKPGVYILTDDPSTARRDFGLNRFVVVDARDNLHVNKRQIIERQDPAIIDNDGKNRHTQSPKLSAGLFYD